MKKLINAICLVLTFGFFLAALIHRQEIHFKILFGFFLVISIITSRNIPNKNLENNE